ncbi:uncharacterized protein CLUP02_03932 [Colletotrichum lupini]|uniref:Uncharacterized protein n=1 Tax=Colletotrichum lupini TaxID=145971 RepID=A0A9Q8WDA9_9PEZI|nr:uncharacterized protein CLUP02_03932 [Colletotrichum lupini]UQC78455.1 hypothetical protein CLUP02_03932 [Colletotrichum lupini]
MQISRPNNTQTSCFLHPNSFETLKISGAERQSASHTLSPNSRRDREILERRIINPERHGKRAGTPGESWGWISHPLYSLGVNVIAKLSLPISQPRTNERDQVRIYAPKLPRKKESTFQEEDLRNLWPSDELMTLGGLHGQAELLLREIAMPAYQPTYPGCYQAPICSLGYVNTAAWYRHPIKATKRVLFKAASHVPLYIIFNCRITHRRPSMASYPYRLGAKFQQVRTVAYIEEFWRPTWGQHASSSWGAPPAAVESNPRVPPWLIWDTIRLKSTTLLAGEIYSYPKTTLFGQSSFRCIYHLRGLHSIPPYTMSPNSRASSSHRTPAYPPIHKHLPQAIVRKARPLIRDHAICTLNEPASKNPRASLPCHGPRHEAHNSTFSQIPPRFTVFHEPLLMPKVEEQIAFHLPPYSLYDRVPGRGSPATPFTDIEVPITEEKMPEHTPAFVSWLARDHIFPTIVHHAHCLQSQNAFQERNMATEHSGTREKWRKFVPGCLIKILGDGGDHRIVLCEGLVPSGFTGFRRKCLSEIQRSREINCQSRICELYSNEKPAPHPYPEGVCCAGDRNGLGGVYESLLLYTQVRQRIVYQMGYTPASKWMYPSGRHLPHETIFTHQVRDRGANGGFQSSSPKMKNTLHHPTLTTRWDPLPHMRVDRFAKIKSQKHTTDYGISFVSAAVLRVAYGLLLKLYTIRAVGEQVNQKVLRKKHKNALQRGKELLHSAIAAVSDRYRTARDIATLSIMAISQRRTACTTLLRNSVENTSTVKRDE